MPRIVSLIASATEIVDALGMTDSLVGRSHECDYPGRVRSLPVCTRPRIDVDASSAEIDRAVRESARRRISVYEVFDDVIESLAPTHILTQIQCDVCAVSLRDVEAALARGMKAQPRIVSLQPDSLAGIWDDVRRVAKSLGISGRGEEVVRDLQDRLAAQTIRGATVTDRLAKPRIACIEWIDPLMSAAHWMPELIAMAGATLIPASSWEELAAANPDAVVVAPCGFDLARTEQEMCRLAGRPEFERLRSRVFLADGNRFFNRPGPCVVETLRILIEILYGGEQLRGSAWRAMMSL